MVMMFVGGVLELFDGLLVLFLPLEIYGAGVFVPARTLIGINLLRLSNTFHIFDIAVGFILNGSIASATT